MATVIGSVAQMLASEGMVLGVSEWVTIDQRRIDLFAEATGDHQWIHVDTVRAASGPFGATVAHGYLTLSLTNMFLPQILLTENLRMGVNYGSDRLRFPAPVRVGSRLRAQCELVKAEALGEGVRTTLRMTVEIEGESRPACVVDNVNVYYFDPVPVAS